MLCVDMMIVVPVDCASLSRASISTVAAPSREAVGSSKNSSLGDVINARARAIFCFSPPDKNGAGRSMWALSPIFVAQVRARSIALCLSWPVNHQRIGQIFQNTAPQHDGRLKHKALLVLVPFLQVSQMSPVHWPVG